MAEGKGACTLHAPCGQVCPANTAMPRAHCQAGALRGRASRWLARRAEADAAPERSTDLEQQAEEGLELGVAVALPVRPPQPQQRTVLGEPPGIAAHPMDPGISDFAGDLAAEEKGGAGGRAGVEVSKRHRTGAAVVSPATRRRRGRRGGGVDGSRGQRMGGKAFFFFFFFSAGAAPNKRAKIRRRASAMHNVPYLYPSSSTMPPEKQVWRPGGILKSRRGKEGSTL